MIKVPDNWASTKVHSVDIVIPDQESSCWRKKQYSTEFFAESIAKKVKERYNVTVRVYQCFYCKKFHLTHTKNMNRKNLS